ncbi:Uncharacterised protein [Chlamydia trachomatis]|nr:Uncharacterised protein [Chlamydia trachomatis]
MQPVGTFSLFNSFKYCLYLPQSHMLRISSFLPKLKISSLGLLSNSLIQKY